MKETPATQYFFCRASTAYHVAQTPHFSVCDRYFTIPNPNRRWDDWQLIDKEPEGIHLLCLKCQRILRGEPEPEVNWKELAKQHPMQIMP